MLRKSGYRSQLASVLTNVPDDVTTNLTKYKCINKNTKHASNIYVGLIWYNLFFLNGRFISMQQHKYTHRQCHTCIILYSITGRNATKDACTEASLKFRNLNSLYKVTISLSNTIIHSQVQMKQTLCQTIK